MIQNYCGLEGKIYAIIRELLGNINFDLSDYPTIEQMNEAIAEAIAGGGGGGGTNNYDYLTNKPLERTESENYYGWQMFRAVDGSKKFCFYIGTAGDKCATLIYDPANNSFGIGLVNGGANEMIRFNSNNTIDILSSVTIPNFYNKTEVDNIANSINNYIAERFYTKDDLYTSTETNNLLALKADASAVYSKNEVDTSMQETAQTLINFVTGSLGDFYQKTEITNLLALKADASAVYSKDEVNTSIQETAQTLINFVTSSLGDFYTKTDINSFGLGTTIYTDTTRDRINIDKPTKIDKLDIETVNNTVAFRIEEGPASYPLILSMNKEMVTFNTNITAPNHYTKEEVDALIAGGGSKIDVYTKQETNDLLALKADASDTYTKTEVNELIENVPAVIDGDILNRSPNLKIMQDEGTTRNTESIIIGHDAANTLYINGAPFVAALYNTGTGNINIQPTNQNTQKTTITCLGTTGTNIVVTGDASSTSGLFVGSHPAVTISQPAISMIGLGIIEHYDATTSGAHLVIGSPNTGIVMVWDSYNNTAAIRCNGKQVNDIYTTAEIDAKLNALQIPNMAEYYTKTEVNDKIKLIYGNDVDSDNYADLVNELKSTPSHTAKIFSTNNYYGFFKTSTIFTVNGGTGGPRAFSLLFPKEGNYFYFQTHASPTASYENMKWYKVTGTEQSTSQTITHEAPYTGEKSEYETGDAVFASGRVCKYDLNAGGWTDEIGPTDCICEVKPTGEAGEFVGICCGFNDDTNSIIFATHGDFLFNVVDSSKYEVGNIVLVDESILDDNTPITGKIMKMIVGKVTAIINKTCLAILKT